MKKIQHSISLMTDEKPEFLGVLLLEHKIKIVHRHDIQPSF